MRKLIGMFLLLAVLVIGVGFYRGWFTLSQPATNAGSDTVNINLATDVDKMKQDVKSVKDKATELTGGGQNDVKADGQTNDTVKSKNQ